MPKRKLEEEIEEDWKQPEIPQITEVKIKKNSLDSDEEDESDSDDKPGYQILESDDIEGQEEGTAQMDGEVRITPFNMKEEMEEGHFDADGHYHFSKTAREEVRDHWLDNIDWVKVKKVEGVVKEDESSSDGEEVPFDTIGAYKKIIEFLTPGESVAMALRRLGGGASLSASQKLKLKKQGRSQELTGDPTAMNNLTELANGLLNATGNMSVYQETYEQITRTINKAATDKPAAKKEDDILDMYADDFDVKEKARLNNEPEPQTSKDEDESKPGPSETLAGNDEVNWEFKWSDDSEEIHGPHTSTQMQQWVEEGYFKDTVCVRKVGAAGNFYSCRRVDFELYI